MFMLSPVEHEKKFYNLRAWSFIVLISPIRKQLIYNYMGGNSNNPLVHGLFLDYDIIFYFLDNIEKNQEKFKLRFEYF